MVTVRLFRIAVLTEALALRIIIVAIYIAQPLAGAFNTEVIICLRRQLRVTGRRLQQSLRQSYRRRDAIFFLVLDSHILPLRDIVQILLVLCPEHLSGEAHQCHY